MADKKISELTNITGANLADTDEFVVVDASANETKAITYDELKKFNGTVTADTLIADNGTFDNRGVVASHQNNIDQSYIGAYSGANAGLATRIRFGYNDGVTSEAAENINFVTNTVERMRIDSSGNVGIGTVSPAATLDVAGAARIGANNKVYTEGGNLKLSADDNNTAAGSTVDILVDGLEVADFTLAGYLRFNKDNFSGGGICTQSLDSSLQIAGGTNAVNSGLNIDLSGPSDPAGAAGLLMRDGTTSIYNYVRSSDAHIWYTGGSERVRITSSGNVGIGTTNPGSKLSIVGLPTSSAGLSAGDIWNDSGTLKIVT